MSRSKDVGAIGAATLGTGAVLTAGVASACCVGPALAPIFLSILGAGGLATVAGLRPFSPLLFLGSAAMLAFAFRQSYRRSTCEADGSTRVAPASLRVARGVTWVAAILWLAVASYALYGAFHE